MRRLPKGGPSKPEQKRWRALLVQMREKIQRSSRNLADEALKSSGQDFSVDHMADHGTDNFDQDFSLSLLEGETEVIRDIEDAIDKIDGRSDLPFGLCEECEKPIARARLRALPYARLCVDCKTKEE